MAKRIQRHLLPSWLRNEVKNGQFFSVRFTKRSNGEIRDMTARFGVKKGVSGVGRKGWKEGDTAKNYGLLSVYDVNKITAEGDTKGAFRMIPIENIISLKVNGEEYIVVD